MERGAGDAPRSFLWGRGKGGALCGVVSFPFRARDEGAGFALCVVTSFPLRSHSYARSRFVRDVLSLTLVKESTKENEQGV